MVIIDSQSGFCFGVVTAINKAEEELKKGSTLYCLGEIVHNEQEVNRLAQLGLQTINNEQFACLKNARVLLRAHGEPPKTYATAQANNLQIIDASCPVVLGLQRKIKNQYEKSPNAQIIIFGKKGHAEVIGLQGQTNNTAIVVENANDLEQIDFSKDIYLFSQTTKSSDEFKSIVSRIEQLHDGSNSIFEWHDTICGQVRNRTTHIQEFARSVDKVVFLCGKNSSNGKVLFGHCKNANPDSVFISSPDELSEEFISRCKGKNIGICGATSTPLWLMQKCANRISQLTEKQ